MSEQEGAGGEPLAGRSQEEGACVDTGSQHTEAKMPPAQVPCRPTELTIIIDPAQLCTCTLIHAYWASIEPVPLV